MGTPCELGAFLFGVAAPWTTSVARGSPVFRTDGFWQTRTEAMAGFLPLEWTAEGVVWQGVSASVFVSESGSCVCLWFLVFLGLAFCRSCRLGPRFPCIMPFRSGCRCPQAQGRPSSRSLACMLFGERAGQSPEL